LTNLTELYLQGNEIADISALSSLANVTDFQLLYNQISDLQALVDNAGLGAGDSVNIQYNNLDLTPGSDDMLNIQALESRGVTVTY